MFKELDIWQCFVTFSCDGSIYHALGYGTFHYLRAVMTFDQVRGGIKIKNGKIADFFPNRGEGSKKKKSLKFKFGHLKTHGGGLNFSKKSEL